MTSDEKSSSPNFKKIFNKQLMTLEQVQQASIKELSSDPLLWAAYKRGRDEHFSKKLVTQDSHFPNDNGSLSDANCQQNKNVRKNIMKEDTISQQYRLQKKVIIAQTNCKSNQTEIIEADN